MLLSSQIKAARALLGWAQGELAKKADVALPTLKRMESGQDIVKASAENAWKVQKALEDAGIEFIAENGGGAGVRGPKQND